MKKALSNSRLRLVKTDRPGILRNPSIFLLYPLGTVNIPAITDKFVVRDHFAINIKQDVRAKISWIGYNFQELFSRKIEEPKIETSLRFFELKKAEDNKTIICELGGEVRVETTLAEIWWLMDQQGSDKKGPLLLLKGSSNIFYARDYRGEIQAVFIRWCGDSWYVFVHSANCPIIWYAGDRIFVRNF